MPDTMLGGSTFIKRETELRSVGSFRHLAVVVVVGPAGPAARRINVVGDEEANVAGDAFRRMEAADAQPGERGGAGLGVAASVAVNLSPTTTGIGTVSYRYRYKTVLFHTDMTRAYRSALIT